MEINIDNIISTVRTVDSDSLLNQKTLKTIVDVVIKAVEERESHLSQVLGEQGIESSDDN